jgi:hypothetical protein
LDPTPEAVFDKGEAAVDPADPAGVQNLFLDHSGLLIF